MKKIFSILSAGLMLLALGSCVNEQLAVFDPAKDATAPVLGTYTVNEDGITASYTPGSFSINEKIAPNHALALVEVDGEAVSKILSSSNKDGVLSITTANLSKNLVSLGYAEGSTHSLKIVVRATMQDTSKDNGLNGYIDSEDAIEIASYLIYVPVVVGSPYADYTEAATDWTVIGSLSNYGIEWNGDLSMWTDGNGNYVAPHVKLAAADQFKFRKDQDWAVNLGGEFSGLDTEIDVTQDGPNIIVGTEGVYDLFLYTGSNKVVVSEAYDPLPDFTQASNWSVIGALSNYDINWNGDIDMVSDGTSHVALGVSLSAADEFKFRQDKDWAVNLGGDFAGIDTEFAVTQDGSNIVVGEEGVYDLFVNPSAGTAKITAASGVKISGVFGASGDDVTYSIIGDFNGWSDDVMMTEKSGVWTANLTVEEPTTFKIRKDKDWTVSYGASEANVDFYDNDGENDSYQPELGVAFATGNNNIYVEAGTWAVTLDLTGEAPTIKVEVPSNDFWGVIGDFNGWGGDVFMSEVLPGVWVSDEAIELTGGWKIRKNAGWDDNRGGALSVQGQFAEAVPGGDNISLSGTFKVVYNANNETIGTLGWGVVGSIASIDGFNWNNDVPMNLASDGKWYSIPVALTTSDKVKIRKNAGWDDNFGGTCAAADEAFAAVAGGDDLVAPADGTYMLVYDPTAATITFSTDFWGLIGDFNGWSGDKFGTVPSGARSTSLSKADGNSVRLPAGP